MHVLGPACSYDRLRIKRGDIFSRNIRSREIEAESDKPSRIFLLLFSIILEVTRIRRTYPAFYQRGYDTRLPLFALLSFTLTLSRCVLFLL